MALVCSFLVQPSLSSTGSADIPISDFCGILTSEEGVCPFFRRFWSMCSGLGDSPFMSPKCPPGGAECHKSVCSHCLEKTPGALLCSGLSWRSNDVQVDQIPPQGTHWDYFCHSTEIQTCGDQTAVVSWCHQAGLAAAKSGFLEDIRFISALYSRSFAAVEEF